LQNAYPVSVTVGKIKHLLLVIPGRAFWELQAIGYFLKF